MIHPPFSLSFSTPPQTTQEKLQDDLKLAQFMKDADQIDAASASHEAFLDFNDLGNSLDDVENLMKNHEGEGPSVGFVKYKCR